MELIISVEPNVRYAVTFSSEPQRNGTFSTPQAAIDYAIHHHVLCSHNDLGRGTVRIDCHINLSNGVTYTYPLLAPNRFGLGYAARWDYLVDHADMTANSAADYTRHLIATL